MLDSYVFAFLLSVRSSLLFDAILEIDSPDHFLEIVGKFWKTLPRITSWTENLWKMSSDQIYTENHFTEDFLKLF